MTCPLAQSPCSRLRHRWCETLMKDVTLRVSREASKKNACQFAMALTPPLQPGVNQITIVGFTPTMDENSIKVEGTGSAVISDISVELLPNREFFHEIYPDSDDDNDDDDDEEEEEEAKKESAELKEVRGRLTVLRDEEEIARETISSAETRLRILDT